MDVLVAVSFRQGHELLEFTNQQVIEQACYSKNQKKIQQTVGTLAMHGMLMKELEFIGDSQACQNILKGTYQSLPNIDYYSRLLLQQLYSLLSFIDKLSAIISTETF